MTNRSEDRQIWERIRNIIAVNLSVIFTMVIWLGLFISMLVGYFSIPVLIIVIVVTYLTVRERIKKSADDEGDAYRDSFRSKKDQ